MAKIQSSTTFQKKRLTIKRALISVYDKTGIESLARELHERGVEIISTGGTAKKLRKEGIMVTEVNDLTGFPEIFEGRVKTLHPKIHGALLARPNLEEDSESMAKAGIEPIQLVVVNLYPFQQVVDSEAPLEDVIENIDIGGPAMIRAAAKNVDHVCVLSDPSHYEDFIRELDPANSVSFNYRFRQAKKAFLKTSAYDNAISNYLILETSSGFPEILTLNLHKQGGLRYGENPHQAAAVYGNQHEIIECLHGKQLSYNNYLDLDAALNLIWDFKNDGPTVAIIKHTIPCGVAVGPTLAQAWKMAFATDTSSPFGGIVAVNRKLDLETATEIDKIFTEIIVAPEFEKDAFELLSQKANRRLVVLKNMDTIHPPRQLRTIFGGLLCQQPDNILPDTRNYRVVTNRQPDKAELRDLLFAWKVVKRVNSNAIVYARNLQTLGIGSGQPSRVDSSELAVNKAAKYGLSLGQSVIASDAFFPFPDGVEAAAKAGAKAVIQPGGSIRDSEVIETANANGMAMIFTGMRHFKH